MKWYKFEEKMPELGTNIILTNEIGTVIGIREFDLNTKRIIEGYIREGDNGTYNGQEFFSDDANDCIEIDIIVAKYWAYPSSIKLPKRKDNENQR